MPVDKYRLRDIAIGEPAYYKLPALEGKTLDETIRTFSNRLRVAVCNYCRRSGSKLRVSITRRGRHTFFTVTRLK